MKILIAEDDLYLRDGIREALAINGFSVVTANDGLEALEQVNREIPDLICLDIMMPKMDGYEVCREIRRKTQVPIIFISAKSEEIDKVVALELGGDDYLAKPFGVRELIARIKAVARRSNVSTSFSNFQLDYLTINSEKMIGRFDGKEVELSYRDIAILRQLYQNRGNAVTKKQLFENCWERNYFPESRTLDQHISQLRKKIERDPNRPALLKTVHGFGYMIP